MPNVNYYVNASLDDTYAKSTTNYPIAAYAEFGHFYAAGGKGVPPTNYYYDAFIRFLIKIPKGSTIISAIPQVIAQLTDTTDFVSQINFTDEDDAADFTLNPYARADGGTDVPWTVQDFIKDAGALLPDISTLIQAFIDRAGYNANNHIVIRIKCGDAGNNERRRFYQWDGDPFSTALLSVTYAGPSFGNRVIGSLYSEVSNAVGENIEGAVFTINHNGTADSIVVALKRAAAGSNNVKCAIYRHSDLALIGQTEEILLSMTTSFVFYTFNFSAPKPVLVANTQYVLVVWADYTVSIIYLATDSGSVDQYHKDEKTYNAFPDPLVPVHFNYTASIYCWYTLRVTVKAGLHPSKILPLILNE